MKHLQYCLLGFLLLSTVSLSSCTASCQTCVTFGVEETICESDFPTRQDYEDALASAESQGYCIAEL